MAHFIGYKPTGLYAPIFDVLDGDCSKIENIDMSPDGGAKCRTVHNRERRREQWAQDQARVRTD
jgi:hypothetical protein